MIKIYSLRGEVKEDIMKNHKDMVYEVVPEEYNNWNISLNKDVQIYTFSDCVRACILNFSDQIVDSITLQLNDFAHIKIW